MEALTQKLTLAIEEGQNHIKASEQASSNLTVIISKQKEALEAFRSEAIETREAAD